MLERSEGPSYMCFPLALLPNNSNKSRSSIALFRKMDALLQADKVKYKASSRRRRAKNITENDLHVKVSLDLGQETIISPKQSLTGRDNRGSAQGSIIGGRLKLGLQTHATLMFCSCSAS